MLLLCGIGMMLTYKYLIVESEEALQKQQEQEEAAKNKDKSKDGDKPTDADDSDKPADGDKPETPAKPEVEPETVTLTGKNGGEEVVKFTFTAKGGGVKFAEMLGEKNVEQSGKDGFVKINELSDYSVGSLATDYKNIERDVYSISKQDDSSVEFVLERKDGITITKKWRILDAEGDKVGGYRLKLEVSFTASDGKSVRLSDYSLYTGTAAPLFLKEQADRSGWYYFQDDDYEHDQHGDFTDGWFSDAKSVINLRVEDLEYYGVDSQFFTTTIYPSSDSKGENIWVTGKKFDIEDGERWKFYMGAELPDQSVDGGQTKSVSYEIYMGPKFRNDIVGLSENSDEMMNYGWFSFFSHIMSKSLTGIHNWFPEDASWSWAIALILLTLFIRIIIWPLHNKSTRTMKRMSKLQPIIKEMREKYKDNPQKMNQETMKLYREYGVNPMGGCLPMLVQIPIFFGVFRMISSAVEMRGHGFLWVNDLSQPDTVAHVMGIPINILPILMAVTMVLQMRMTPQTGDKLQRRIFMLMPLLFFFFCYGYASALALYWTTQNIISIGQTWLTQRMPEPELEKKAVKANMAAGGSAEKPRKKGFMEKMVERMEEMQDERDRAAGKKVPAKKKAAIENKPKKRKPRTGGK